MNKTKNASFKNGEQNIACKTVEEVITALKQLPSEMQVKQEFGDCVEVNIYHDMYGCQHVGFESHSFETDK